MENQEYQFDIIHWPGKHNEVADALSRREYPNPESLKNNTMEHAFPPYQLKTNHHFLWNRTLLPRRQLMKPINKFGVWNNWPPKTHNFWHGRTNLFVRAPVWTWLFFLAKCILNLRFFNWLHPIHIIAFLVWSFNNSQYKRLLYVNYALNRHVSMARSSPQTCYGIN